MARPDPTEVADLYRSGVEAVARITAPFDGADWARPACGEWSAEDTVRHLVGVIDWYHEWLDRALDGVASPPFSPDEFVERNAATVAAHGDLAGPEAVARFVERSDAYLDRAMGEWDTPYGFPLGTVTAGLHVGVAASEWHIHAWDLSSGDTTRHRPDDSEKLFFAAGSAFGVAKGGLGGALLGRLAPLGSKRSPWQSLLKRSGRQSS